MNFNKIEYDKLKPRQKEIYNFQKLAGVLAEYGFNCMKLSDDWNGADFLAVHPGRDKTLRVQLKPRISIDKKYQNKDLYVAFPDNNKWYLIKHDELVNGDYALCKHYGRSRNASLTGGITSSAVSSALAVLAADWQRVSSARSRPTSP